MQNKEVYIVSAARTPVGCFGGSLSSLPAATLGSIAIRSALERAHCDGKAVDEVTMGCVLSAGQGQAPARQSSLGAGIPSAVPCTTVNKVCGSGLHAVILAGRSLILQETNVAVAGGMENMSMCPYVLPRARTGYRLGNGEIVDSMVKDGLWDVYNDIHMGTCADNLARERQVSREEQDDYAVISYERAIRAAGEGLAEWEIVPVEIPQRTGDPTVSREDEGPKIFDEQKMRRMKPAFNKKDGTITAGNASSINDGAAAVVLANESGLRSHDLTPLARVVSWGYGATDPRLFPIAPVGAVDQALRRAGVNAGDIDFWEINEAFAVVPILAMRKFDLDVDRVNPLGGAVSIGHPIGASGARILTTLLNVLRLNEAKLGLATLCIGGGEGIALLVERL